MPMRTDKTRQCGECQLCCKLLPVRELGKLANQVCTHQGDGGCKIYSDRPRSCKLWSCIWLNDAGADIPQPHIAHYVVDPLLDSIRCRPDDGSPEYTIPAIQVWVDPEFRDAYLCEKLRAYINARRMPAIIRYNSRDGFLIAPPSITPGSKWQEKRDCIIEAEHTPQQLLAAFLGAQAEAELGGKAVRLRRKFAGRR